MTMTYAQATKLLELAKKAGQSAKVRTFLDDKPHMGKAFFFEVIGKNSARIKPFKHQKEEIVPLSNISFWRSNNNFDIEEAMNATIQEVQPTAKPVSQNFMVFSRKMKGVWSEHRRWVQDVKRASRYTEMAHAARAVGKLNKAPLQDDAQVMTEEAAAEAILDILTEPKEMSLPTAKTSIPVTILQSVRPIPSNPLTNVLADDDFIDVSALFNENETSLRQAEAERKKASEEYASARKAYFETMQRVKELNSRVVSLGGRSILKSDSVPSVKRTKRVLMRKPIQDILKTHSRLSADSIFERLVAIFPEIHLRQMMQSVYGMKSDGLIEQDDNAGWALTSKGRKAEMMG